MNNVNLSDKDNNGLFLLKIGFVLIWLLSFSRVSYAQTIGLQLDIPAYVNKSIPSGPSQGDSIRILGIVGGSVEFTRISYSNKKGTFGSFEAGVKNLTLNPLSMQQFWQSQMLAGGVYDELIESGYQFDLRHELEQDAIDFHAYLSRNNLLFNDEYLETHLYALINELIPETRTDRRPGLLTVSIMKDSNPNAFILPNGAMYLTTGLLSVINSDLELQAILAHEAAHFMLDHAILNINAEKKRKERAIFWASFATIVAAGADAYIASNNAYYTPGLLTAGTAMIAFTAANEISNQMGLKYSREQEAKADGCARDLLTFLGKRPEALSTALEKIKNYAVTNGDYTMLSANGTHPDVNSRISAIGQPIEIFDSKYDIRMSIVTSYNAIMEYNARRFDACASLAQRNISAGIATEDDYLLLAMTNMYRFNSDEKNQESLALIQKAKTLNVVPNITAHKQEALALIRLNKLQEAKVSLETYLASLEKENTRLHEVLNPEEWSRTNRYLLEEYRWTKRMLNKVEKL